MAKGNAVLKITGIFFVLFGIMNILFAMMYGFVGAMGFEEMGKTILTGLLIFYGLYGVLLGFFQIGCGAMAIRQSNKENHWLRCVIWGVVLLILGVFCTILLFETAGMIHKNSTFYPKWFGFAIVIVGGIALPIFLIIGGLLNKITYIRGYKPASRSEKRTKQANRIEAVHVEEEGNEAMETAETSKESKEEIRAAAPDQASESVPDKPAGTVTEADSIHPGGRLDYLKHKRLSRNVDPRKKRKFGR